MSAITAPAFKKSALAGRRPLDSGMKFAAAANSLGDIEKKQQLRPNVVVFLRVWHWIGAIGDAMWRGRHDTLQEY